MFGRICCLEKRGWRVRLVREEILGLTLLRAEVPAPVRPRRKLFKLGYYSGCCYFRKTLIYFFGKWVRLGVWIFIKVSNQENDCGPANKTVERGPFAGV